MGFKDITTHLVPALIIAMGIYLVCLFIRHLVEFFAPSLKVKDKKMSVIWRELILPFLPVVIGLTFTAFATFFPFPSVFGEHIVLRMIYGAVVGFFSGWAYRILKVIIQRKWEVELPELLDEEEKKLKV